MIDLLVLPALLLGAAFCVWPGRRRPAARAPFETRCFAHRGLFGADQRPPENSLAAFRAAAAAGYGIELDVQFTADRQLVVFHDDTLDRMTPAAGRVDRCPWAEMRRLPLAGSAETPPTLAEVLAEVARAGGGATPLIVEIKSRAAHPAAYRRALCRAVLDALAAYPGPCCIESFDPRVVGQIRRMAPGMLRGQLADSYRANRAQGVHPVPAFLLSHCFGNFLGRPDFLAWCPEAENWAVRLARACGAMMVQWTLLPGMDTPERRARYQGLIFQWYAPRHRWH